MDYNKIYKKLCSEDMTGTYLEAHHILPTCMGGSDENINIVKLTAKGHYLAHWLLIKIYPEINKLHYAWWAMNNQTTSPDNKRDYRITSAVYENARVKHKHLASVNQLGEKNHMFNKTHTAEAKAKISAAHIGRKISNETRKAMSNAAKKRGVSKTTQDAALKKLKEDIKNKKFRNMDNKEYVFYNTKTKKNWKMTRIQFCETFNYVPKQLYGLIKYNSKFDKTWLVKA